MKLHVTNRIICLEGVDRKVLRGKLMKLSKSDIRRFYSKVDRSGGHDTCWVWTAGTDKDGYGRFRTTKTHLKAHRVSFFLAHGRWPQPCCLHRCDNPSCVNPNHLFEGTNADNNRDMVRKGRNRNLSGSEHWSKKRPEDVSRGLDRSYLPHMKLNDNLVRKIRIRVKHESQQSIADSLGISQSLVSQVVLRKIWGHVQ